jgi:hypothetical protein
MRAAEELLNAELDVAGIKAQFLGRIEELEAREREREELVGEVSAAMAEEHGLDAGPLKAALGGLAAQPVRHIEALYGDTKRCIDYFCIGLVAV